MPSPRQPRLDRDKLTAVLAELDKGTAPSTIARKVGVGYATVARIAENDEARPASGHGRQPGHHLYERR